jgi:protoporphyrin/coproporphyrin ferrochelatase
VNQMPTDDLFSPAHSLQALPEGHPEVAFGRIGVLLVNLGTPDGTSYWPMRRYLKEFLSDRRVIEVPRLIWWPILNLIILSKRPFASGKAYRAIWNTEMDESPLRTITRAQAEAVAQTLKGDTRIVVDWAMRYGTPSIASRLEALKQAGCERILLFPLYPQYAAATTATVCDTAFDALKTMRWQPSLRVVPPYYDDPAYIEALAASMRASLATLDFEPEMILASYHGLPVAYFENGDPYHCHCAKTTRLLRAALGLGEDKLMMTFQSRFGRAEWLRPYTAQTIEELAQKGVKRLAVVTPGFAADCIETLEEIAMQGAEHFREHGGERFAVLPCLNASAQSIDALSAIAKRELLGWSTF